MKLALVVLLLSACTTTGTYSPRRVSELPQCYVMGERGIWLCDVKASGKSCRCISQQEFERWKQRNGL